MTDQTFVLGGIGGNPYDLGIHIQGEVESKRFTDGVDNDNGMQSGPGLDGLYRGGKPTTQDGYSSFLLRITGYEGGLTTDYYLNSLQPPGVSNHTTYGVDYSFVISVEGQSIVRLVAADFNCSEIANCGPHQNDGSICAAPVVVQNIEPSAQALNPGFNFTTPYNGQWLVITATDVTRQVKVPAEALLSWPRYGHVPIHSSPCVPISFFQIGARRFRRSMAARQASNASARCGAAAAMTTAVSPTASAPTRWWMATRAPGHSRSISSAISASTCSAISM